MTLDRHFHTVLSILDRHWVVVSHETECEQLGPQEGHIASRVTFLDDSYLQFEEFVYIIQSEIRFGYYKYQYVKEGRPVFRYDNFRLHPKLSPPYHHKHSPGSENATEVVEKPKLTEVIEEISHTF